MTTDTSHQRIGRDVGDVLRKHAEALRALGAEYAGPRWNDREAFLLNAALGAARVALVKAAEDAEDEFYRGEVGW